MELFTENSTETERKNSKPLQKLDLQRFVEDLDMYEAPLSRLSLPKTTIYEVCIHKEARNCTQLHTCICGSTKFKKNGMNKSNSQRYKCVDCGSSRVLSIKVFNIDLAFDTLYDLKFTKSCMAATKNQKKQALIKDKKTRTFFNACVQELFRDQLEVEEIMEIAFSMTCKYIEEESWKLVSKRHDDWYFLQNRYDGDVRYRLQDFIVKMIRTHNIQGSSVQDQRVPLLFCDECGSVGIQRYNYNSDGRRTIKCQECGQKSIIRVKNLIPMIYFNQYYRYFFQQISDDDKTVTNLINHMREDFYNSPIFSILEDIFSRQLIITILLRDDILRAFLTIQKFRLLMHFRALGREFSYMNLLNLPKDYDEITEAPSFFRKFIETENPDLYNWEKRVEDAFKMLVNDHKWKLITR